MIRPVPKPPRPAKKARAWNSTLGVARKAGAVSGRVPPKSPASPSSSPLKRGGKMTKKKNGGRALLALSRSKPIARKRPIGKRRRSASEFKRIYGSKARVEWFASRGCFLCGGIPAEGHHARNGGTGRKADAKWVVPLCSPCHRQYHQHGYIRLNGLRFTQEFLEQAAEVFENIWQSELTRRGA